jgi:hypothetical protein
MIGINEELKTIEAARAVLSTTNPNSKERSGFYGKPSTLRRWQ